MPPPPPADSPPASSPPAPPSPIAGERVVLRAYEPSDEAALQAAVAESRAHLRPWMPWADSGHLTVEESAAWIAGNRARWDAREELVWAITRREDGRYLGGAGLHACRGTAIDWSIPALMIGYWIRASEEGKGYVGESVRLLTRTAFEHFHANRLELRCDSDNVRSVAVMERAGFRFEGCHRSDGRKPSGALRDTLVYAWTPDDYAAATRRG